ncbi:filamentous hemagglutinin N-terminal domain-containing protein [Luteimonas sp. SJ-92]|uniref:Filamentous hemagglutinin N-terminal domain-containing protein n=1 Tax=Luteimonas salinisoli TaxID=2752307 RepID=A0A853JJ86_9GAMM|nr:MBG domain-containing protein [Luteimonas salinisoli]NZA28587.1 filamentous hemagglutinin N-terminal domain-containing protein [Luteimonas salinisoli]
MRPYVRPETRRRSRGRLARHPLPLALAIALATPLAHAQVGPNTLPTDPSGLSGIAPGDIQTAGNTMTIAQPGAGAIINWESFSIGSNATVDFNHAVAGGVTLNRVIGNVDGIAQSEIMGALNADNGRVFIVNPSGVLFGAGAQVSVGGLVASALSITDADFNAGVGSGSFVFNATSPDGGSVENAGTLIAGARGTIALLGGLVENFGTIDAPLGTAAMASAQQVTLDFFGDGLTQVVVGANGVDDGGIRNTAGATISADGGSVQLRTQTEDGLPGGFGGFISNTGLIRARTLANRDGRIVLDAGAGNVLIGFDDGVMGATLDASGMQAGARGGTIEIHGDLIGIFGAPPAAGACQPGGDCTLIDVSGDAGGGAILVESVHQTFIGSDGAAGAPDQGIEIRADASSSGTGGTIVLTNAGVERDGVAGGTQIVGGVLVSSTGVQAEAGGGEIRIVNDGGGIAIVDGVDGGFFGAAGFVAHGGRGGGSIELDAGDALLVAEGTTFGADATSSGSGGLVRTVAADLLDLRGIEVSAGGPIGAGSWEIQSGRGLAVIDGLNGFGPPGGVSLVSDDSIGGALGAGTDVAITVPAPAVGTAQINIAPGVAISNTGALPVALSLTAAGGQVLAGVGFDGTPGAWSITSSAGPLDLSIDALSSIGLYQGTIGTNGGAIDLLSRDSSTYGVEIAATTLGSGGGDVSATSLVSQDTGVALDGATIDTGGGALALRALNSGGTGVSLTGGGVLASGTGAIEIVGIGGSGAGVGTGGSGVFVSGYGIQSAGGTIVLSGRGAGIGIDGGGNPLPNPGLLLGAGAALASAGGDIVLNGSSVGSGAGVQVAPGASVDAGDGSIVLRAGNDGAAAALLVGGSVATNGVIDLRAGEVGATGAVSDRNATALQIGGGAGAFVSMASLANIAAPDLVIGHAGHAGAISIAEPLTRAGNLTLQNTGGAGGIALNAAVSLGSGTLALVSGGDIAQTAAAGITAQSLLVRSTGGSVGLTAAQNDVSGDTLAGGAAGGFGYADVDALAIGSVTAWGFDAAGSAATGLAESGVDAGAALFVRNHAGDLTLGADVGGNVVDLVTAGRLQNIADATITAGDRWRVWADTWVGEQRGGLAGSGPLPNLYGCSFGGPCGVAVPVAGNHFIYRQQPTATISVGDATREYGLDNPVFAFGVSGLVLGDQAGVAIAGAPATSATILSDVGTYAIGGSFSSPAGYAIQVDPGVLAITPAPLTYVADPFTRFFGQPNGVLTGTVTGFRNGDTLADATTGALMFVTGAGPGSPPGLYAIAGTGLDARNYRFVQDPANLSALRVVFMPAMSTAVDLIRLPTDSYVYDRNIGMLAMCPVTGPLDGTRLAQEGDLLSREWSRVRSRPNLTSCISSERKNSCGDF